MSSCDNLNLSAIFRDYHSLVSKAESYKDNPISEQEIQSYYVQFNGLCSDLGKYMGKKFNILLKLPPISASKLILSNITSLEESRALTEGQLSLTLASPLPLSFLPGSMLQDSLGLDQATSTGAFLPKDSMQLPMPSNSRSK